MKQDGLFTLLIYYGVFVLGMLFRHITSLREMWIIIWGLVILLFLSVISSLLNKKE